MEIRYRREISHNYLIIKTDGLGEDYEMRMAEENCVGGFLPLLIKESEGGKEFYYEITSRQPLSRMVERKAMSGDELRHLVLGIAGAVTEMEKYLLSEENILLEPDYIYIEPQNYTVSLCFLPGYRDCFPDAVGKLMEYLLGKISHDDRGGVVLAYELFQATKQENYGIRDLLRILYQPDRQNGGTGEPEMPVWESRMEERRAEYSPVSSAGKADWGKLFREKPSREKSSREKRGFLERFKKKKEEEAEVPWQMVFPDEEDGMVAEPAAGYQPESFREEDTAVLQKQGERAQRRLVSISGDEEIKIFYFPFLLGKQEGLVDYVIARDTVSRLHARIDQENGGYTVTDLNSTNGIRVDGRLLETNETVPLSVGSEIYLADAGFLFL